jgi:type IV secretory pathway TraG/TraD family ATPase VirD4
MGDKGGIIVGQSSDAKITTQFDTKKQSNINHLKKPGAKLIQAGMYNVLCTAPTRSGKGVGLVVPTHLAYPGSIISLDFKGENFNLTSGFRAKFGRVFRWS